MRYFIGIDGGGTRTTLALADGTGRELLRRTGPAGLVDPRRPSATAEMLAELVHEALATAGIREPVAGLCAGLAGVGNRAERETVQHSLERARIAERVTVRTDGETALHGALSGGAGILIIAGTGSVAYGRSVDGRVERCGGWGMVVGDEGSGFALGRAALTASLCSVDGRGPPTRLLPAVLEALGLSAPESIPPWAGRAEKSEIAALAVHVLRLADEGDGAARVLADRAARGLADHAAALATRLGPWTEPIAVVLHGGVACDPAFNARIHAALDDLGFTIAIRGADADAVSGAVHFAIELIQESAR